MFIPLVIQYFNWDYIRLCAISAGILITVVLSVVYFGYFNRIAKREHEATQKRLYKKREELRLKSIKIDKEYKELFGDKEGI